MALVLQTKQKKNAIRRMTRQLIEVTKQMLEVIQETIVVSRG